ncbi:MAG TPA: DUF3472 domain-containing protein [Planctomycetes bacterium]|nr:DUF3472 domain-containing protein [Planctomycetota bacterium]
MRNPLTSSLLVFSLFIAGTLSAQNSAPSSHMVFDDRFEGDILIQEVRVPKSGEAMYTYYETLGWRGLGAGYAGIQAHPKAHNYIFSIWDHKNHTAPIRAVYHDAGTKTEGFGGEGTGLKSWNFELGWDTDVWYTLVLRSWEVNNHTHYGYWVRSSKSGIWTHMVTMDVASPKAYFQGGTDAFIEDWLNTGKHARTTNLRNGWKRRLDGSWYAFGQGRYSVNFWDLEKGKRSFNYKTNWNGGVTRDATGLYYFMTAGGEKTQATALNPSTHSIKRTLKSPKYTPLVLRSVTLKSLQKDALVVDWVADPKTLPPFSVDVKVYDNQGGIGKPLGLATLTKPHARSIEVKLTAGQSARNLYVHFTCEDILGNRAMKTVISKQ